MREKTNNLGSDQLQHKPALQSQTTRSLKFRIEEEGLYYPCSENKGADQLRSNCKADLCLLFSPVQIVGFPMPRLICFDCEHYKDTRM